jgi:hypothetical protein
VIARIGHGRHAIHRDVINPAMAERVGFLAATVIPLRLGAALAARAIPSVRPAAGAKVAVH